MNSRRFLSASVMGLVAVLCPPAITAADAPIYIFSTLAGAPSGTAQDGPGNVAGFAFPTGVTKDSSGNIYVADSGNWTIRKISPAGEVSTFAGKAGVGGTQDGTGSAARFEAPRSLTIDSNGNIYVGCGDLTLRKITPAGVVTTIAGSRSQAGSIDGVGMAARFGEIAAIAGDGSNYIYIADSENRTIRRIAIADASVTTIAGAAGISGSVDGTGSAARFKDPRALAVDSAAGLIYVGDAADQTIRQIVISTGAVTTLAGRSGFAGATDGVGADARFSGPQGLMVDNAGIVYVAENSGRIRKIGGGGTVTTLAGTGYQGSTNGPAAEARFNTPMGMIISAGNLFIADAANNCIRKISASGIVSIFAGVAPGTADGTGAAARFFYPLGVTEDSAGNVFVADHGNHTIRKISAGGVVTTLAGAAGFFGSTDGVGLAARFQFPAAVAVDALGNLFIADSGNQVIRKISSDGTVSVYAGQVNSAGSTDGVGTAARFNAPQGVTIDASGNLYVADTGNHTVRKISTARTVTTLAGQGGLTGTADGTGNAARFNGPSSIAVDATGNLFVADLENQTVRKITPAGVVTTFAGQAGVAGTTDGQGSAARFNSPWSVAIDTDNTLYVADANNQRIRKITAAGTVSTLAGSTSGSDEGVAAGAKFMFPVGVGVGGSGRIYVTDAALHTLRVGTRAAVTWSPPAAIIKGTPLSSAQLNATANVPGQFTYSVPIGTVLQPGEYTITVSFVPTGASAYPPLTADIKLVVQETPAYPVFSAQPRSRSIFVGSAVQFVVLATGSPQPTFQWQVSPSANGSWTDVSNNSTYTGAASATLTVNAVTSGMDGYRFRCVALNAAGSATSDVATLAVVPNNGRPLTRLANISARGYCGTGDRVMIGGFVVGGSSPKRVLVRAVGPTLVSRGIGASEVLADPTIEVHQGVPVIASNDNWGDNANVAELTATATQIGAGALDATDTKSSALLLTLSPGGYTFVASGKGGASGIVLLEVYDADDATSPSTFVNIATRAYATTANGVTIGGFVISGNTPKQVLLRAVGPTLTKQGIGQADVLVDPTIELHDANHGNATIAINDNWADNANAALITATAARIGAAPIDQTDTRSSALLVTLEPGVYSFIASGKSATSGIVLVEVYDAD